MQFHSSNKARVQPPALSCKNLVLIWTVAFAPTFAVAQSSSEDDPLQDGIAVADVQPQRPILGGAFEVTPTGNVLGLFIPVGKRTASGMALPDEIQLHDKLGDRALKGDGPEAAGAKGYVKSRQGRFVAIVSRDRAKKTSSTEIYDLVGKRVAVMPQHVVAVSPNARFAALNGYARVAEVSSGNIIDLALPSGARNSDIQFADDSDAFTSTYRRDKELFAAAFASDGSLLWRKAVMTGNEPLVRNTLFSPSGDRIAIVAGELPTDHLTLFDSSGKALWTKEMPPGNYAMAFTADGDKLLLINRDGHVLFSVADGAVLWEKPFPVAEIERNGSLIATKILLNGNRFVVASRTALSVEAGKKPHQTTSRVSGPDLIYTIDQAGHFEILLNRPSGTFLVEGGRFHFEPIVVLGGEPAKIYYLTSTGLRTKAIR